MTIVGNTFKLDSSAERFSITDLARTFDVTPRTIRFYEAEGLLAPERAGQTRIYSRRDRARLAWILRGKNVGFSLADIRELLDLYDTAGPAKQQQLTIEKCRERIAALRAQRRDIDATIAELKQFIAAVEAERPATASA